MRQQIQFRLDRQTWDDLHAFIAKNPQQNGEFISRGDAARMLIRTALGQPKERAIAHELVAATAAIHQRIVDGLLISVGSELESLGFRFEILEPEAPVENEPVADVPED